MQSLLLNVFSAPKDIDDSWIVDDVLATIPLIDPSTQEIGFTGGEPTLLGDDFFRILRAMKSYLPQRRSISSRMVDYLLKRNLQSDTPTFGILIRWSEFQYIPMFRRSTIT